MTMEGAMAGVPESPVIARLFVPGRARTKGHIQPVHVRGTQGRPCRFGGGKDRPETQEWMKTLNGQLQERLGIVLERQPRGMKPPVVRVDAAPHAGPVEIHLFFRFNRELSIAEAAEEGEVWPTHDVPWPTARSIGDEDTLRRSVLDALTKAGVVADDSLSVGGQNWKRWTLAGEQAGVLVVVQPAPYLGWVLAMEKAAWNGWLA